MDILVTANFFFPGLKLKIEVNGFSPGLVSPHFAILVFSRPPLEKTFYFCQFGIVRKLGKCGCAPDVGDKSRQ